MTSVKTSGEKGVLGIALFLNTQQPSFPWDKSKNPYLSRNSVIPKEATAGAPETRRPVASWFQGPDGCLIGNYAISQWVWVLAIL